MRFRIQWYVHYIVHIVFAYIVIGKRIKIAGKTPNPGKVGQTNKEGLFHERAIVVRVIILERQSGDKNSVSM